MIHTRFERTTPGGAVLHGEVRVPDGPPPRSLVLVLHGFKGFKDWGFFPYAAHRLAAAGHAVVTFNFSGSGVGQGDEVTDLDAFASNTFTRELDELHFVLRASTEGDLLPRPPTRVGLLGHSRGGGNAILAASTLPVHALVTWAAVSTFQRWSEETRAEWREQGRIWVLNSRTGRQLPLDVGLLDDFERNRARLDVLAAAGLVSAPWLIAHGVDDLTVPVVEAHALARAAPHAKLVQVEGAGHTFEVTHPMSTPSPQLEEVLDATLRHFARHLLDGEGA